jgi:hypothetical protein
MITILSKLNLTSKIMILLFITFCNNAYSCFCEEGKPFLKNINQKSMVVKVKVLSHYFFPGEKKLFRKLKPSYSSMKVLVIENYGKMIFPDTLTIIGGQGIDCLWPTDSFNIGKTYILNLSNREEYEIKAEMYSVSKDELVIWVCNENVFQINGNIAIGRTDTLNLIELETHIKDIINNQRIIAPEDRGQTGTDKQHQL